MQLTDAFGNFIETNLDNQLELTWQLLQMRNGNIRLPDGSYRICFYARYITSDGTLGDNASDPNLGCGTFTINCAPINGVQVNTIVKPQANPVISQAISAGKRHREFTSQ